jgi:RNA polymerase sigma-70 factor (ECF subfamily)
MTLLHPELQARKNESLDAAQVDPAFIQGAVAQYEGRLVSYAQRILGDVEKARDVVQDTFMRLCRQDPAAVSAQLSAWLYTVCRNRAFDVLRREKRMVAADPELPDRTRDPMPNPETVLSCRRLALDIESWLSDLPPRQEEVIRLKFMDGLSYKEIAAVTGNSVSNVGYLIHAGMKRLRQWAQDSDRQLPDEVAR